jgi:hypothetical protein
MTWPQKTKDLRSKEAAPKRRAMDVVSPSDPIFKFLDRLQLGVPYPYLIK